MAAPLSMRINSSDKFLTSVMVVVVDGVSLTTVSTALEPFHLANRLLPDNRFKVHLATLSGHDPVTQSGIPIPCDHSISGLHGETFVKAADLVIVCGGPCADGPKEMEKFLRSLSRLRCKVFAIGSAGVLAASIGLLRDKNCSTHWNSIASLEERFPDINFASTLYSSDGRVTSCAGELAAFDMVVDYIQDICGPQIGAEVCNHFLANGNRSGGARQLLNGDALICDNKIFQQAIQIMTENIEEPLIGADLALRLGVSPRQVQRIFAKNGFETPRKYYLNLRLNRAQQLIEQTRMPLTEIGIACGFENLSAFNKCYKRRFGVAPRDTRNRLRLANQLTTAC